MRSCKPENFFDANIANTPLIVLKYYREVGKVEEKLDDGCIGKKIREQRTKLALTQRQVADYVGVTEATVSRWESGDIGNMKRNRIARLAKVLKVSPLLFITGVDEEEKFKPEETELVTSYRELSAEGKKLLQGMIGQLKEFTMSVTV